MSYRVLVAEWWEIWVKAPKVNPVIFPSFGVPSNPLIPTGSYVTKPSSEFMDSLLLNKKYRKLIHVKRYKWVQWKSLGVEEHLTNPKEAYTKSYAYI